MSQENKEGLIPSKEVWLEWCLKNPRMLKDDEFVQDKQNQNKNEVKQDLRDSIFMEGIETDSPIGDIRDSVLMGDINVNINNSIDPEYISNVIIGR